jgi:hypothetical protein
MQEDFMKKLTLIAIAAAIAAAFALVPAVALAGGSKDRDAIIKRGVCTVSSTSKPKAKPDNGWIEAEFEVDQNVAGKRWRVTITRNGVAVFSGIRRTAGPSGSFEVRRLLANSAGADRIVAKARALSGGESCRAAVTL